MSHTETPSETIVNKSTHQDKQIEYPSLKTILGRLIPRKTSESTGKPAVNSPRLSRRDFLKGMAVGAAAVTFPDIDKAFAQTPEPTPAVEQGEILNPSDRAVLVDMDPNFDNQKIMRDLLGDLYAEDLDLVDSMTGSNIGNLFSSEDDKVVATLLASEALKSRQDHGEIMTGKYVKTLANLGYEVEAPIILPLQESFRNIQFSRDKLGNPSIIMETDEQQIGKMLEQHFAENPSVQCVNLSLQIGKARIKRVLRQVIPLQRTNEFEIYDEDNNTEYVTIATDIHSWTNDQDGRFLPHRMVDGELRSLREDEILTLKQYDQLNLQHEQDVIAAYQTGNSSDQIEEVSRNEVTEMYNPEFARENLARLVELCRRFPDKSFNVSGGNENSFFYEIRLEMEASGEWADNLTILAGEEDKSDGADIYLKDNFNRIFPISSSESAVIVTAFDSLLASQGLPLQERRQSIRDNCQPLEFKTSAGNTRVALSLDPNQIAQELSNQT